MENQPKRPLNYLVWAILSTIFCCLPLGIVSIVYSVKVNSEYDSGNYAAAVKASNNAKTWIVVTAIVGIVSTIVIYSIFGLAFLGIMSEEGGF